MRLPFKSSFTPPPRSLNGHRAVIITTSQKTLDTVDPVTEECIKQGPPTGVYSSEMTEPYYVFKDAGLDVTLASIQGGLIPIEPQSLKWPIRTHYCSRFLNDSQAQHAVTHSVPVQDLCIDDIDIVFISGGWGAAYDLAQSPVLATFVSEAHAQGKIVAGVCHGVLGLVSATKPDGSLLLDGTRATGVTNKQLKTLRVTVTPRHPETELCKAGALYECSHHPLNELLANHVTIDKAQRVVTGQNQKAGPEVADAVLALFEEVNAKRAGVNTP